MWGTDIEMASNKADDQYITKTGTSFAAPMLSGLTGLLWESGRRAYGESWPFRWTEARQVAQSFCTKPQEAPVNKDNSYGYGLPAMGSMLGQMTQINSPLQDTMQVFSPMIGIALMAGMLGAI
jgi:serine protease AprX